VVANQQGKVGGMAEPGQAIEFSHNGGLFVLFCYVMNKLLYYIGISVL